MYHKLFTEFEVEISEDLHPRKRNSERNIMFRNKDQSGRFNTLEDVTLTEGKNSPSTSECIPIKMSSIPTNNGKQSTLSIVYESGENGQRITTSGKVPAYSMHSIFVKTDAKRKELKSAAKNSNGKKQVISFFQDLGSMNSVNIENKDSLSLTSLSSKGRNNKIWKSYKRQSENKKRKIVSKVSAYKSLIHRIEFNESCQENEESCKKYQKATTKNKTDEALECALSSETDVLLQNKIDNLNKELEYMVQKRNGIFTKKENRERDIYLRTYNNNSAINVQIISEIFSSLPSSNRVLNEFVHSTKNKRYTVKQEYNNKRSYEKIATKPIELISKRETNSLTDFQHLNVIHQADDKNSELIQNKLSQETIILSKSLLSDFCPESTNLLKYALLKEIQHRTKKTEDDEKFYEGLEISLKANVTKLINELRTRHKESENQTKTTDITAEEQRDDITVKKCERSINKLNIITEKKMILPLRKTFKKTGNRAECEGLSIKYNKALKQFKQTLLNSDSDSSILPKNKVKTVKKSPTHDKIMSRDNKKGMVKGLKVSCTDLMKNRKLEVQQKLKEYSRKRTLSNKRKLPNTDERIKTNTGGTIKSRKENSKDISPITKPVQKYDINKNIVPKKTLNTWKDNNERELQIDDDYELIPQEDGIILRRKNEMLYIIDNFYSPFDVEPKADLIFQKSLEKLSSQRSTIGKLDYGFFYTKMYLIIGKSGPGGNLI